MSWFEVESKVKVGGYNVDKVREKIKKIASFVKKEKKSDYYFAIEKPNYPRKAFRMRYNGKNYIINFKKWLKKYWKQGIVVKEEFEFEVKNKDSFLALMKDIGFVTWIKKLKITETYKHKKISKIFIELNYVKHLGYFIEIEYLANKNEIENARKKITHVLKELNIRPGEIENTGYTKLLWKKRLS
ncbi:MAG: class IV adenylate cyclase [Nanoarchaeota archaeon]